MSVVQCEYSYIALLPYECVHVYMQIWVAYDSQSSLIWSEIFCSSFFFSRTCSYMWADF